ncbi:MAG TPA: ATP-binding cassette domain-containing protein [Acidimicrobiia bacterium]|nr:ATP-binding cassette domain-containing protein [Acidimicrobiia bacterium]
MLAVRDLTIEYTSGGYRVRPISDLSIDVASGELVLLLGASGCGKTTLLSALATLLTPTAGTIHVGDVEVTGLRGPALLEYRRKTVGVVFQAFNLIPSLNARENIEVALRAAGVRRQAARARALELLDHVGLTDRIDHRPADLSGGQQQRVAIARALAHDPPLVLADEPTAHLDYIQVDGVLRLLRELARPGRVVVVATHDDRLLPLADRVVELSARAVADARPPAQVDLAPGQVLFRQGDPGDLVYVVESGEIELVRDLAAGGEELVHVAAPGGYFGELAPMFGLRRSATARARTPAVVTGYSLRDFRARRST